MIYEFSFSDTYHIASIPGIAIAKYFNKKN